MEAKVWDNIPMISEEKEHHIELIGIPKWRNWTVGQSLKNISQHQRQRQQFVYIADLLRLL